MAEIDFDELQDLLDRNKRYLDIVGKITNTVITTEKHITENAVDNVDRISMQAVGYVMIKNILEGKVDSPEMKCEDD